MCNPERMEMLLRLTMLTTSDTTGLLERECANTYFEQTGLFMLHRIKIIRWKITLFIMSVCLRHIYPVVGLNCHIYSM